MFTASHIYRSFMRRLCAKSANWTSMTACGPTSRPWLGALRPGPPSSTDASWRRPFHSTQSTKCVETRTPTNQGWKSTCSERHLTMLKIRICPSESRKPRQNFKTDDDNAKLSLTKVFAQQMQCEQTYQDESNDSPQVWYLNRLRISTLWYLKRDTGPSFGTCPPIQPAQSTFSGYIRVNVPNERPVSLFKHQRVSGRLE